MKYLIILIIFLVSLNGIAQEFSIPANFKLETKDDYQKYENDIINGFNWLMNTPANEQVAKRKNVNAFILKWLSGSPSVSIAISQDIVTFMSCADCFIVYMGSWAKYTIETKDKDVLNNNVTAIESVIQYYQKNKKLIGKNKAIEKYIKLKEKGKLTNFLKSKIVF